MHRVVALLYHQKQICTELVTSAHLNRLHDPVSRSPHMGPLKLLASCRG